MALLITTAMIYRKRSRVNPQTEKRRVQPRLPVLRVCNLRNDFFQCHRQSERLLNRGKMLHQMCVEVIVHSAREQTFAFFRDGAIHMLGYLLVRLHGHSIQVSV